MANSDVRAPIVLVKGKKVADANDYEFTHDPNDEVVDTADGTANTVGNNKSDITLKGVTLNRGASVNLIQMSINHQRADVQYVSDGNVLRIKNAIVGKYTKTGKTKDGSNEYTVEFHGGTPESS